MDRLDIASGGEDRALIDFFAAAELKRDAACNGMRMGPDTVHAAWLDERAKCHAPQIFAAPLRN